MLSGNFEIMAMMTATNTGRLSKLRSFLDWSVAILGSIALHFLFLHDFSFGQDPLPLLTTIEVSLVFEEPKPSLPKKLAALTPPPPKAETAQAKAPRLKEATPPPTASRKMTSEPDERAKQPKPKPVTKISALSTRAKAGPTSRRAGAYQPVHRGVPYLNQPVEPTTAAVIRAVRDNESRMVNEDRGRAALHDDRYSQAAARAVARYEQAADQGYVMAQYNLALALAEGRGTAQDYNQAIRKLGDAVEQGNVPAMLRLAEMHLAGLGTPKNRIEAQALYYVAASIDSKGASRAKAILAAHMDNTQLVMARKRARTLRAKMPAMDLTLKRGKEMDLQVAAERYMTNLG